MNQRTSSNRTSMFGFPENACPDEMYLNAMPVSFNKSINAIVQI